MEPINLAELPPRNPEDHVRVTEWWYEFGGIGYGYCIDKSRCQTAEQLCDWLVHMMGKTWFDCIFADELVAAWEKDTGRRVRGTA